jgi:hypothetical protein
VVGVLVFTSWAVWLKSKEKKKEEQAEVKKTQETVTISKEKQKGTFTENYVSKEILFLPWGSGEGEVGLKETQMLVQGMATTTVRYGPSKLEIDKEGNIYIWDIINKRGLKFKYVKGKEGKKLYKYLSSIPLPTKLSPFNNERIIDFDKSLVIDKPKSEYHYKFYRDKNDRAIIEIKNDSDRLCGKIEYKEYYKYPISIDKKGNVYILLNETVIRAVGADGRLELYKYSRKGNLLTKIELSKEMDWTFRTSGRKDTITVDKDGNIYQLLPKKDGIHVLKWEIK